MGADRRLVVAIHDVAPPLLREVRYLLDALDAAGVRPRVLKVIPNADGRHDIGADPAFARLLADEAAGGSEIVLHGYTHRAAGPARGSWTTRLRARLFAGTAAEFVTLETTEMRRRLRAGQQTLQDLGLAPRGFCAPCWLTSHDLAPLLAECGFAYYTTMLTLVDIGARRRLWTPWIGYMGVGAAQERLVGLGACATAAVSPHLPILKVFLHPQGAMTSPACARIVALLGRLARERRPVTYGALLAR